MLAFLNGCPENRLLCQQIASHAQPLGALAREDPGYLRSLPSDPATADQPWRSLATQEGRQDVVNILSVISNNGQAMIVMGAAQVGGVTDIREGLIGGLLSLQM